MTKAQEHAIERIREMVISWAGENGEIKEWKAEPVDYSETIFLTFTCGMIGDEGTLAEVIARDRAHLFIGVRGGAWYYADSKRGKRDRVRRRFEWRSIGQPIIDQWGR